MNTIKHKSDKFIPYTRMVKVIRQTQDARLDYFISKDRAKYLLDKGMIHWDVTNNCYGTDNGKRIE
jgi:hypothetical protein